MSDNVTIINVNAFPDSFPDSINTKKWDYQRDFADVVTKTSDDRMTPYLNGWSLWEHYDKDTHIPNQDDPTAQFEPVRYFKVIKKHGELNYREDERDNEICLTLFAHWRGYDHECEVNLFITGPAVKSGKGGKVSAEILKVGGAPMRVMWNGKTVTDFQENEWFYTKSIDKDWIDDMSKIT